MSTPTYNEAIAELEELVQKLQDPQCSIDKLSEYTKRAKELLELCKKRLTQTDAELKEILESLG